MGSDFHTQEQSPIKMNIAPMRVFVSKVLGIFSWVASKGNRLLPEFLDRLFGTAAMLAAKK